MIQKKFEELNLSNAFLFAAVLEDEETCRIILEVILGRKLPKVKVHVEHSIMYSSDLRSIRLDVYASDEVQVGYNLEMQNKDKAKLPKRSRFHQAEIDIAALKPGDEFDSLKPTYIIFICTFDPFEDKLYRYTFEERCLERNFPLGDETCKIFLNTKGTNSDEVPEELVHFLHYVENSNDDYVKTSGNDCLEKLHYRVQRLKRSRHWREHYMTFEEYLRDIREEMRDELKEEFQREMRTELKDELQGE
ncbi:MAG: Rpn family recombination-promoting nuclease/putative transposase, partial [Eubacteriales bacterium]|nr:Rpn family recombination-promoting nuclease/putative transposase [Eubacteriales bacterium]